MTNVTTILIVITVALTSIASCAASEIITTAMTLTVTIPVIMDNSPTIITTVADQTVEKLVGVLQDLSLLSASGFGASEFAAAQDEELLLSDNQLQLLRTITKLSL